MYLVGLYILYCMVIILLVWAHSCCGAVLLCSDECCAVVTLQAVAMRMLASPVVRIK